MSNPSEFELDQDLQLLPAWARQPSSANRYAHYEGGGEDPRDRRRGDRPFGQRRPGGDQRRPGGPGGPGGFGAPGGRREGRRDDRRGRPDFDRGRESRPEVPREPQTPLPEVLVNLIPEKRGIESLARQIKLTGRAYPLFQIAALILKRPDRFEVQLHQKKGAEGQVLQPLCVCSLDETVWLSEEEVAQHVLQQHFDAFYQTERVATEPPKGTYTLVAQCGMSGVILGPPNYHDYQTKLRKLHGERFSNLPFEVYKARVKIVRDEAVVKQWLEEQSWKSEYVGLNLPEPVRFTSRELAEKHFRETHLPNLVKTVEAHTLATPEAQRFMSRGLRALLREAIEDQRRFPLKLATLLSQQLAGQGLQFFKVNKTVTHVCVARPHFLDLEQVTVSDGVRRIIEFIDTHAGCTRRKLIDALAPAPPVPKTGPVAAPVPDAPPAVEGAPTPAVAPAGPMPTPEQTAVITDLHWLIHQGHVIEFTDGRMETAKQPKPKPVPPPRPPRPAVAPTPGGSPVPETPAVSAVPAEEPVSDGIPIPPGSAEVTTAVDPVPMEPPPPVEPAEVPAPTATAPDPAIPADETRPPG
jgi:hypothetical protein